MKKLLQIFMAFSFLITSAQTFQNGGFEDVSCANDCTSANSQMDCVDNWFANNVTGITPLQKSFCNADFVCSGDYSIMLSQTSGAPSSDVKTVNPFQGMNLQGMPQIINVTAKVIDDWSTSGTGIHIRGTNQGPGTISQDQVNLGFTDPPQNDVCVNMGIIVEPDITNFSHLIFATSVLSGSHLGGHSAILDNVGVCGDLFNISNSCGNITIQLNDQCNVDIDITELFVEVTGPGGTNFDAFSQNSNSLTFSVPFTGQYNITFYALYTVNGQFKILETQFTQNITSLSANDVVITADDVDITDTLSAAIACGESCITLNATNVTDAVYNTSAAVLTDLNGLFCVPPGSTLTSFVATITGFDSCGDPYAESVNVSIEQDCCSDEPYIAPYWSHPDCPDVVCTATQWPIQVLSEDGTPITSAGGVTITWVNAATGETHNQDWIYTEAHETWIVTITYPDGCEYTATYVEDCCEDDIHIEAIDCPEEAQLRNMETALYAERNLYDATEFAKMEQVLAAMIDGNRAKDCDPCDEGWVLIHLVNGAGDPIDAGCDVTWSDGGSGTMRLIPVNTSISVTVVKPMDGYDCVYEDTFSYDCEEDCDALSTPINLQLTGSTLSWDPVPGAVGYLVEPGGAWPINCQCQFPVSIASIPTETTSVTLPIQPGRCFVVQVRARCADGTLSAPSEILCVGGGGGHGDDKYRMNNTMIYPNPNNGDMNLSVETSYDTKVSIYVYDFFGRMIQSFEEELDANKLKSIAWNASDRLPKGVYFVTFITDKETINKRVVVE